MSRWSSAVEIAHAGTLAALVGVVGVDPTAGLRSAPDWPGWLSGQQRVDRVMSRVGPPLFLSTTVVAATAAVVAGVRHQSPSAAGRAVAAACTAAAVAVTLTVNEPLNARIRSWRPVGAPPPDWRAVRARWERGHRYRRVLVAIAGLASLGAQARTTLDRRRADTVATTSMTPAA